MPANMKTKLSSSCSREGNGLQPCWQSSKISKNSDLEVKLSAEAAHDTSRQSQEDVFSSSVISGWDIECVEDIDLEDLLAGPTLQFQHSPLFTFGSSFVGRLGSLPSTCPSILETIFSPFLELDEVPRNMIVLNCEGTKDKHPDMATTDIDNGHSDNQTCNIWDFNISDMGIAGLSFEENVGLDDIVMRNLSSDFQCVGPDLMFDMADGYMILPFLEESMETSNTHEGELVGEVAVSSDDACLYMAIQQLKPSDQEMDFDCYSPDMDAFDPHLFLRNFPDLSEVVPSVWPNLLPKETRTRKPVTLVLDLDETLVHSTLDYSEDADFTFPVYFNMKEHIVYVRQRPHLQIFLERVAEMFQIIVFTASQSIYAEQLLDILDPEQRLISRRVFRESCIFSEGSYMKDLTVLELDLAKVAIIDNSPQVFRLQVNNGIPIQSWFDDPSDCALVSLIPFLETLADADDVRPIIAKRFNNKE